MNKEAEAINIFFLGKGGVGKSTSSALTAIQLADKGYTVLLVSLDPAHNQSDIFEKKFSEKPSRISRNLSAKEIDINYWIKKYLNGVENQIRKTYSYLTAFNLEKYFGVIKYSPGIEEYALLTAYQETRDKYKDKDYIIFDMPPTALTLKFFGLPKLSLMWLEKLSALREEIIEKRKIITKIKLGKTEIERDKILNKINQQTQSYGEIKAIFENGNKTMINLVMNPDKLSFSESLLIKDRLSEFNLRITNIVLNKYYPGFLFDHIEKNFEYKSIRLFRKSDVPLIGVQSLENYLSSEAHLEDAKI